MANEFEMWLEFEEWIPKDTDDPESDFFNAMVTLSNGQRYALNIWTFNYFEVTRRESVDTGEYLGGKYLLPPDLFIARLDRALIEEVIADLLSGGNGTLKKEWLVVDAD